MKAGALEAALSPSQGGALLWFARGGTDILRRTAEGEANPLGFASFPLVPYANRIAHGRFPAGGGMHQMPLNFGDHPHSLHGHGWQTEWLTESATATGAILSLMHEADDRWPWSFRAEQRVTLSDDALAMALTFTNLSDEAAPVGLGFHPYFQADDATTLQFEAEKLWLASADMLPEQAADAGHFADWGAGAPVRGETLIDNVYEGWNGTADVARSGGLHVKLTSEGAPFLHVYRPPGLMSFCLEPVSHMPNAINRDGMETLAPGASRALSMTIAVHESDETLS